jgi:hypothetical protein
MPYGVHVDRLPGGERWLTDKYYEDLFRRRRGQPAFKGNRLDTLRTYLVGEMTALYGVGPDASIEALALVAQAVGYVDRLKAQGKNSLPWETMLFGRLYLVDRDYGFSIVEGDLIGRKPGVPYKGEKAEMPPPRYGYPIELTGRSVVTGGFSAVLLRNTPTVDVILPYTRAYLHANSLELSNLVRDVWLPQPDE